MYGPSSGDKYFTEFFKNYAYKKFKVDLPENGKPLYYLTGPKDVKEGKVTSYSLLKSTDDKNYIEVKEAQTREKLMDYFWEGE